MDVGGVGAGPTGTEFSSALRGLAGSKGQGLVALAALAQSDDTIAAMLLELSKPEVVRFLETIERPPAPETAARLEGLLRASVSAAAEGNVQQALVKLAEFAALDPRRAETLETEPGLASIRADVGRLLFRLASAAQLDAELRLGQATHLLQAVGSKELMGQEIRPEIAILIAGRLLEAGGYANCMRSAELSQMPINQYGWAPTPAPLPVVDPSSVPILRAGQPRLLESMDAVGKKIVVASPAPGPAIGVVCSGVCGRFRLCVAAELLASKIARISCGRRL